MQAYCVQVQGVFVTNCYFLIDPETGHGFLIDPGAEGAKLARIIRENGWTIEKILLTHGHFDHTGGIRSLQRELGIPVYCHTTGPEYLLDPELNLSRQCGPDILVKDYRTFKEGECIALEANPACALRVIHTPGHTRDSVCLYDEPDDLLFVGDTIFKGSPGSDRYPSGNGRDLLNSITEKILKLPDETTLLSGHSDPTNVGAEKSLYTDRFSFLSAI